MDNVDPCCLLMLPAELRLHIHSYVIPDPPLSEPLAQYSGLLHSCKQVRAEMEPEIKKRVNQMLANILEELVAKYHNEITFGLLCQQRSAIRDPDRVGIYTPRLVP